MNEERIQQLVNQALAYDAVSDPRGQIEMTIRMAIKEASSSSYVACPPEKPTDAMLEAGADTGCFIMSDEDCRDWIWRRNAETVWRAMWRAAPSISPCLPKEKEMEQPGPNSNEVIYEALLKANAEVDAYRKALDKIIADPDCDPVQVAHQAITPFTDWKPVSAEESARLDAAVGIKRHTD